MDVTDEQLRLLKAISNLKKMSLPSSDGLKQQAQELLDLGLVEYDADGELHVPDDVKWKLFADGRIL